MLIVALVSLGVLLVVLFSSFVAFDKLVKSEYTLHHRSWIADGKPAGFFWRPKESDPFIGQFARLRLSFSWLFLRRSGSAILKN